MTPSTTSDRAPMKQLSSMIVGPACIGSSTPADADAADRCTFLPIWAQDPTVAHVSTIVPSSTKAPRFTKQGIRDNALADMRGPAHHAVGHRAKNPAAFHCASPQWANLAVDLVPPCAALRPAGLNLHVPAGGSPEETAFFAHWFTCHVPSSPRSATRKLPVVERVQASPRWRRAFPAPWWRVLMVSARLPGGFDGGLEMGGGHGVRPLCVGIGIGGGIGSGSGRVVAPGYRATGVSLQCIGATHRGNASALPLVRCRDPG